MSNGSLPYYKRYTRDILDATAGMDFEVKGAYSLLIDLMYHHNNELRDNPRFIAGTLNCSVRKWNSIRQILIDAGKIEIISGLIRNYRVDKETEILRTFQDKQAEKGKKPWKNNTKYKATAQPKGFQPEPEPLKIKNKNGEWVLAAIPDENTKARALCDLMLADKGQAAWAQWFNRKHVVFDGDCILPVTDFAATQISKKFNSHIRRSGMTLGETWAEGATA